MKIDDERQHYVSNSIGPDPCLFPLYHVNFTSCIDQALTVPPETPIYSTTYVTVPENQRIGVANSLPTRCRPAAPQSLALWISNVAAHVQRFRSDQKIVLLLLGEMEWHLRIVADVRTTSQQIEIVKLGVQISVSSAP